MKTKISKIDYTNQIIYIGLDVHDKSWHATLIIGDRPVSKTFAGDPEKFYAYISSQYPGATFKLVYEAGCFGFWIKERLDALGVDVIVVHPADVPTTDKEQRQKTDKSDSKKLAYSLKGGMLKGIYVPDKESQEHRELLRRRNDLTKKSTRIKNQIKAKLKYYGIPLPDNFSSPGSHWSKCFMKWLGNLKFATSSMENVFGSYLREIKFIREEILIVTRQIRKLEKTEKYSSANRSLQSIPGIASVGAANILFEVIDIHRFKTSDEFLSFVGLVPTEHSSGAKQRIGHMNRRCRVSLRRTFIEAAWIAVRLDSALTLYFNNCLRHGSKTYAIIKVAKKLANRARYLLINKCEYCKGIAA